MCAAVIFNFKILHDNVLFTNFQSAFYPGISAEEQIAPEKNLGTVGKYTAQG